jgi:hypothetical protein
LAIVRQRAAAPFDEEKAVAIEDRMHSGYGVAVNLAVLVPQAFTDLRS